MNQIIIIDNYGNRFFEFFEDNGQVSGFDYTCRRNVRSKDAGDDEFNVESSVACCQACLLQRLVSSHLVK